ncbi:hypothetical protein [Marinobacterium sedimentorum]|uniref:hypothetical protein n=1 Tax=Marinobacterium sedimentorum TaxID=2927804 RepID=UPI0020C6696A|nr:hypothetical protein [Marinobacterium sedimentorum]MCP8688239.1 hypothetical protein [Marinobacterium sedimentorum]
MKLLTRKKRQPAGLPLSLLASSLLLSLLSQAAEIRELPELPHARLQMQAGATTPPAAESVQLMARLTNSQKRGPGTEVFYDLTLDYVDSSLFNPSTQQMDATSSLSGLAGRSEGKSVLRQFLSSFETNSGSI